MVVVWEDGKKDKHSFLKGMRPQHSVCKLLLFLWLTLIDQQCLLGEWYQNVLLLGTCWVPLLNGSLSWKILLWLHFFHPNA